MSGNGNGGIHPVTLPIMIGVATFMLGVGSTVLYVGGSLRQIDINTANIARLDPVGNSLLAMKAQFDDQKRNYDQLAADVRSLPAVDSDFRASQAALKSQAAGLQLEIDAIKRDFRPREFWEKISSDASMLRLQIGELIIVRDRAIPEWNLLLQRVASLEAHHNDLMVRVQLLAGDLRDELNFYRNTTARRADPPVSVAK